MAFTRQTRLTTTALAGLATLSLLTSATACSSDESPKNPKIADAAPRLASVPPEVQPPPTSTPTPPVSGVEAKKITQDYFDLSRQAKSAHDLQALDKIESGPLLDISKARQDRILKHGDNIPSSEERATNDQIKVVTPEGSPIGTDRWILSIGRQSLSGKSRSSLGILRQSKGTGPWKMTFLSYSEVDQKIPEISKIATKDGTRNLAASNIDYGEDTCLAFGNFLNGNETIEWGPRAKSTRQIADNQIRDGRALTSGGSVSARMEKARDGDSPAWITANGDKIVMCSMQTTSKLTAGPSGSFSINQSSGFQNLNGRTTKWKTLDLTNSSMIVLKIPALKDQPVDIIAESYRALSTDGTSA